MMRFGMYSTFSAITLLLPVALYAQSTYAQSAQAIEPFELFKRYIQGDFDNREQVEAERRAGNQIHPFAKHVNRLLDEKITDKPASYNPAREFHILEESYYVYPDKPQDTVIKPYLFRFTNDGGAVKLHSLQIPARFAPKDVRNDNAAFRLSYNELELSPTFKPTSYTYNAQTKSFSIVAPNEFPGGVFTLEETISDGVLLVMERLVKGGTLVTPYTTPLEYKRVQR
jgi:hypothetical protein